MLIEALALNARRALPAVAERAVQRSVHEAAERGEERIARRAENRHVKVEVRFEEAVRSVAEPLHALERLGDTVDRVVGAMLGGERRGRGLHHLSEHEQVFDELQSRPGLQMPGEHVGIE